MKTPQPSQFSIACAIALVSLFATSNGLAAKQHAPKPATSKKAESSKKAVAAADAVPPYKG